MTKIGDFASVWADYGLDLPRIRAICALVDTGRKAEAARQANVSIETVKRWLEEEPFLNAYEVVLNDVVNSFRTREPALHQEAIDYLISVMRGEGLDGIAEPEKALAARINAANKVASQTKVTAYLAQTKQLVKKAKKNLGKSRDQGRE